MDHSKRLGIRAALATALLGATLPWIRVNPHAEAQLLTYISGMGSGLETYGFLVVPLVLVTFAGTVLEYPWISTGPFRAGVGGAMVALPLWFSWWTGYGVSGSLIMGSGVYVTAVGGVVLLVLERRALSRFVPGSG
ncbi:uncharacterized protein Nmag_3487 [Natrialba magadii ATCC 43099]|uniref:Uncharacterized protein n=1 Tax=Natrialba magadii (strain ATCC 43099 / DSM 3394 / CCM 3739 / CIP 104546 / IAM 13178 / JCM 8861 / NBRC 102185 / NCIMB 2190 / MS3) TaxID=547559 RepID=D3STH0_NATMM|nr:hypothetical protein [Natrialba magadii]ADD07037.1 uncharacterized protein Nmag_3487 [Natrialba magadii ATCC 43099]ELY28820.1 hypothetical protein C500_12780 [Natrialba magadii ATCC 43099]